MTPLVWIALAALLTVTALVVLAAVITLSPQPVQRWLTAAGLPESE